MNFSSLAIGVVLVIMTLFLGMGALMAVAMSGDSHSTERSI